MSDAGTYTLVFAVAEAAAVEVGVTALARRVLRPSTRLDPASLPTDSPPVADAAAWLLATAATVDLGVGLFLGGLAVLVAQWYRD